MTREEKTEAVVLIGLLLAVVAVITLAAPGFQEYVARQWKQVMMEQFFWKLDHQPTTEQSEMNHGSPSEELPDTTLSRLTQFNLTY